LLVENPDTRECLEVVPGELRTQPFTQWATALADDQTLTAALLDRLLHHAHIVQISPERAID
jgi:hypothetical protein